MFERRVTKKVSDSLPDLSDVRVWWGPAIVTWWVKLSKWPRFGSSAAARTRVMP